MRNWWRPQPLDYIVAYFGAKIAMYFAWLEYYTWMLFLASLMGLVPFLYGVWEIATAGDDPLIRETCDSDTVLCPVCDRWCDFRKLSDECTAAYFTRLVDNEATMVFAVLMAMWSTVYLVLWKRYEAEIMYR